MNIFPYLSKILKIADTLNQIVFPKSEVVLSLEKMSARMLYESLPTSEFFNKDCNGTFCIFKYRNQIAKEMIWEIKYKKNKYLLGMVGEIMLDKIISIAKSDVLSGDLEKNIFCIIPVPQHKTKVRKRGFNQSIEIVRAISRAYNRVDKSMPAFSDRADEGMVTLSYRYDLLKKIRHTARQNSLKSRHERLSNLTDCFICIDERFVKGKIFIVIDDVHTTGATICEIRKVLIKSGAQEVIGLTIAH